MRGSFVWGAAAGSVIGAVATIAAMPYMKPQMKKFKKGMYHSLSKFCR